MKRTIGISLVFAVACTLAPAQASPIGTSAVTRSGCISIDREWLTVKRDLAGVDAVYKVTEVGAALQHAAKVWSASAITVRAKGGTKVADALTRAATAARALRTKLLKGEAKGAVTLSNTMMNAMEKTVLPACAVLF